MKRLLSCVGAVAVGILGCGSLAFAGGRAPSLTSTTATFVIGNNSGPGTTWTLNLWAKGTRVGSTSGTSGTLTVAVPATPSCIFQADVLRNGKWFSGNDGTFTSCGGVTPTTSTTTKPPVTAKGGHKPKSGHTSPADSLVASPTLKPVAASDLAASTPTPVSGSRLAFTGTGPGLWTLALIGSGLILTGTMLVVRRPRLHR
jgi:hypothetical protein